MTRSVRSCPFCQNVQSNSLLSHHEWEIVRCPRCRFVYLKQDIPYQELEDELAWEVSYARERKRRDRFLIRRWLHDFRKRFSKAQSEKQFEITKQFVKPKSKILEIGCANGKFLELCRSKFDVYGIDISREQVRLAKERLGDTRVFHQAAGKLNFPENQFDATLLFSLLEHEKAPKQLLKACFQTLKPKSPIIIKVPNYGSLGRWILGRHWSGYRWPDHVNYFTRSSLTSMLQQCGFSEISYPWWKNHLLTDSMWCIARKPSSVK